MTVTRHTRMAPAAIQKQWQRIFIQALDMKEGDTHPTAASVGISPVYDFDPDAKQWLYLDVGVPLDWIAPTDWWAYPVFTMSTNPVGLRVRWGIEYLPMCKNVSIAGTPTVIESTFDADGTATIIPPKSQWLTLEGWRFSPSEAIFQKDDFTTITNLQIMLYRDGASALDTHTGNARLQGLALVYQAFI